jgi:hypothetical protein
MTHLDEVEFRRLLRSGLGRPIQYAKHHVLHEFRNTILDACMHCYAYAPQCEGTRADYMLELVDLMPDKEFFHSEVLKTLSGGGDDWDTAQRFRFAACLAFNGNELAKRAMYESYAPGPKMGDGIGINFAQMDGIEGLLFAAEKMGTLLMAKPEGVNVGWLLGHSIDQFGKQETWDALTKASTQNPRIEAYRSEAKAREDRRLGEPRVNIDITYEQLKPKFQEMVFTWITSWGERASDAEIEQAAHGLMATRDPKDQLAHLRIFARRRFPLDIQILLSLVEVDEERVGFAAVKALSQITHPAVRELAFRLVDTRARWRGEAIDVLARNFQPGDHAVVLGWFEAEHDLDVKHSMGMDLTDFWKEHRNEESEVLMLRALYELGPCSFCREEPIRRLLELNALNEEMRAECTFDANDDIRKLVEQQSGKESEGGAISEILSQKGKGVGGFRSDS